MPVELGLTPYRKGMLPVHFTPGQLRSTIGISTETYRHWRRVLPTFVERRGYTPCFSTGDLLAAGILKRLTEECGIRVGFLGPISSQIVRLCNASPWAALENAFLIVDLPAGQCRVEKSANAEKSPAAIVCAFNPILDQLRDALLKTHSTGNQIALHFPLTAVPSEARSRRRRA